MKPLRIDIDPKDVNALDYLLGIAGDALDHHALDRNIHRANKLLAKLKHEVWTYSKAHKILPTTQWELAAKCGEDDDINTVVKQKTEEGYKVLTIHQSDKGLIHVYILPRGAI